VGRKSEFSETVGAAFTPAGGEEEATFSALSCPDLIRASIFLFERMDCRVGPGNDSSGRDSRPSTMKRQKLIWSRASPLLLGAIPKPEKVLRTVL
jgi:hypothetical protein